MHRSVEPDIDDREREVQLYEASVRPLRLPPDLGVLEAVSSGMAGHRLFLFNLTREIGARHVVEIGFGGANSAVAFLLALRDTGGVLTSIDMQDPAPEVRARVSELGKNGAWRFVHESSDAAVAMVRELPAIDILLIDGCHSYNQTRRDYEHYAPLVRIGGYVLFHDSSTIKGVIDFTGELRDRGFGGVNLDYCNGLFVLQRRQERIW
jgi:hypothetical protein